MNPLSEHMIAKCPPSTCGTSSARQDKIANECTPQSELTSWCLRYFDGKYKDIITGWKAAEEVHLKHRTHTHTALRNYCANANAASACFGTPLRPVCPSLMSIFGPIA